MKIQDLFSVRDLVVAVTGGAGGIGTAIAEAMVDNDARVVLMDVDRAKLDEAVAGLGGSGSVTGEVVDVTSPESLRKAYDATLARHGKIDVVFANAGITRPSGFGTFDHQRTEVGAIENLNHADWNTILAINLTGVMATLQGAVPAMKRQGGGSLIVTTSLAGMQVSPPAHTAYAVTKAGAAHLVRQTALELAKFNIRVNAIAPGAFVTGITRPGAAEIYAKRIPMGRVPATKELQGLALFLASSASAFITGAEIPIDGGSRFGTAED